VRGAMSAVLTSASFEPVLVSEGREGIRDHLHELQRRAVVVVTSLERLYESLKRPAVFLDRAYRCIQQVGEQRHTQTLTAQRIAPTSRMMAMRSGRSGRPSLAWGATRKTCSMRPSGQRSSDA